MGTIWTFIDSAGVEHEGHVTKTDDFGGTDVVYHMTAACGAYRLLSGTLLAQAKVLDSQTGEYMCHHVTTRTYKAASRNPEPRPMSEVM